MLRTTKRLTALSLEIALAVEAHRTNFTFPREPAGRLRPWLRRLTVMLQRRGGDERGAVDAVWAGAKKKEMGWASGPEGSPRAEANQIGHSPPDSFKSKNTLFPGTEVVFTTDRPSRSPSDALLWGMSECSGMSQG